MSEKVLNFFKGWSSIIIIEPGDSSVREKINKLRKRNTAKIDALNVKKDFEKAAVIANVKTK